MRILKAVVIVMVSFLSTPTWSQSKFEYQRPITGVTESGWYTLPLPTAVFRRISQDLGDLRVYSIQGNDTTEIPYLLQIKTATVVDEGIDLTIVNQSKKDGNLFFTIELPKGKKANYLDLNFEQDNFNGFVNIEGSTDKKEWFQILEHERILSIKNDLTMFENTVVQFNETDYPYLRIQVEADKELKLAGARIKCLTTKGGNYLSISNTFAIATDKISKQTTAQIQVKEYQPLSQLDVTIFSNTDYYRPYTLEALRDSFKTEKGWIRQYDFVSSGYLTSIRPNHIDFTTTYSSELKLTISNGDNSPLQIEDINVKGPEVHLTMQLEKDQSYQLFYGSNSVVAPHYDLVYFENKIPETTPLLSTGNEVKLTATPVPVHPLFENKLWLWGLMSLIIGVLGFFTLRMMKAKE